MWWGVALVVGFLVVCSSCGSAYDDALEAYLPVHFMSPVSAHVFCSHKFFHSPGNDDPLVVTLPEDNTVILFAWALCLEVDESLHMLAGSSVPLVVDVACDASEENCVVKSHREPLPGTQRHDSIMQMFPESVAREVLRGRPTEVTQADVLEKARSFFSQEANPRPEL